MGLSVRRYLAALGLLALSACGGGGGSSETPVATYSIGGTVSGLAGTVSLGLGGTSLALSSNGGFTIAGAVADGTTYNVAILSQPAGQTCSATNATGTVRGANVTNVTISPTVVMPRSTSSAPTP